VVGQGGNLGLNKEAVEAAEQREMKLRTGGIQSLKMRSQNKLGLYPNDLKAHSLLVIKHTPPYSCFSSTLPPLYWEH
jgi:hypothetical protein